MRLITLCERDRIPEILSVAYESKERLLAYQYVNQWLGQDMLEMRVEDQVNSVNIPAGPIGNA